MSANSVQMFNGLNPESKTSSKVLRPPGGGSTDLFGVHENSGSTKTEQGSAVNTDAAPTPDQSQPAALDQSVPAAPDQTLPAAPEQQTPGPAGEAEPAPSQNSNPEHAAGGGHRDRATIDHRSGQIMSAPVAKSGRVPPGGFSSGPLW